MPNWTGGKQLEELHQMEAKADEFAGTPERFALLAFDLEMHDGDDNHLILYDHNEWSCTCTFFEENGTCAHTVAAKLLLKAFLPRATKERAYATVWGGDDISDSRASTQKLLDLVEREHVGLVIFGHDGQQWQTLKKAPGYYEWFSQHCVMFFGL
jgi:SWIM zinc finger